MDHISRYSKSRRKAPIYWLLQSSKKNYALWLYYHRLDKDILFKALQHYVEPKIRLEADELNSFVPSVLRHRARTPRRSIIRSKNRTPSCPNFATSRRSCAAL